MGAGRIPLLFKVNEDTYLRGFMFASITTAIATGIVMEYRIENPFGTYPYTSEIKPRGARITSILQTGVIAFSATLLTLVLLHLCFAVGDTMILNAG